MQRDKSDIESIDQMREKIAVAIAQAKRGEAAPLIVEEVLGDIQERRSITKQLNERIVALGVRCAGYSNESLVFVPLTKHHASLNELAALLGTPELRDIMREFPPFRTIQITY